MNHQITWSQSDRAWVLCENKVPGTLLSGAILLTGVQLVFLQVDKNTKCKWRQNQLAPFLFAESWEPCAVPSSRDNIRVWNNGQVWRVTGSGLITQLPKLVLHPNGRAEIPAVPKETADEREDGE
jgi:hypothetical protein